MKQLKIQILRACLAVLISVAAATTARSQCVASTVENCTSITNNAGIGTYAWSNPNGALLPDLSYANVGVLLGLFANVNTNYLVAENPGFNIPASATICGIVVQINESAIGIVLGTKVSDHSVKIVKNNAIGGTEHASATAWTIGGGYATYGSPTDLWGLSWLPADVNAANFGAAISVNISFGLVSLLLTADINDIKITVYYDNSSVLSSSTRTFTAVKSNGKINLQWTDPTGAGNDYFIVEKSRDGHDWEKIDSVPVAKTTPFTLPYRSVDWRPVRQNYYRIWHATINDSWKVSDILSVQYAGPVPGAIAIYPNPAHGVARIFVPDKATLIRDIKVVDLYGRPVSALCVTTTGSVFELNTTGLPPGIYLVRAYTQNEVLSSRLLVR